MYWVTFGSVLGLPTALFAALGFEGVVVEGQLAGYVLLLPAVLGIYGLIRLARARLVLTETTVSAADIVWSGSCRREDLASIRAGGRILFFVRPDGSTAFRTDARAWPQSALEAVARRFSVPLEGFRLWVTRYSCPACGYPGLQEPPELRGVASHEICPCCGFEFGETDRVEGKSYETWRQQWIDSGMLWFAAQAGEKPPQGWDPAGQVRSVARGQ